MQVAIVSDIHGNRHAFEAVLADVRNSPAQAIWCLGDVVGYGADPNDCCRLAREHADVCLAGNHDLAVTGDLDLGEFSTGAALAARWTQEVIDAGHRDWLASLKPARLGARRGALSRVAARSRCGSTSSPPCWPSCASTPSPSACRWSATPTWRSRSCARRASPPPARRARAARRSTSPQGEWILNPGSVGQPRDGDARAAWLLLDTERLDRALAAHRVRHRRRRRRDPRRAPARLAGRAPGVRAMRRRLLPAARRARAGRGHRRARGLRRRRADPGGRRVEPEERAEPGLGRLPRRPLHRGGAGAWPRPRTSCWTCPTRSTPSCATACSRASATSASRSPQTCDQTQTQTQETPPDTTTTDTATTETTDTETPTRRDRHGHDDDHRHGHAPAPAPDRHDGTQTTGTDTGGTDTGTGGTSVGGGTTP